jgi:hypothetical protein
MISEIDLFLVLNALPSLHFTCLYDTKLTLNPDEERRTQEYFDILNRNAQNQMESAFQREEFRNTVSLLSQVDDRHL